MNINQPNLYSQILNPTITPSAPQHITDSNGKNVIPPPAPSVPSYNVIERTPGDNTVNWSTKFTHLQTKFYQNLKITRIAGKVFLSLTSISTIYAVRTALFLKAKPIQIIYTVTGLSALTIALFAASIFCLKKHCWNDAQYLRNLGSEAEKTIREEERSMAYVNAKYQDLLTDGIINDDDLNHIFRDAIFNKNYNYISLIKLLSTQSQPIFSFALDEGNKAMLTRKLLDYCKDNPYKVSEQESAILDLNTEVYNMHIRYHALEALKNGTCKYDDFLLRVKNNLSLFSENEKNQIKNYAIKYCVDKNLGLSAAMQRSDMRELNVTMQELVNFGALNADLDALKNNKDYVWFRDRHTTDVFSMLFDLTIIKNAYQRSYKIMHIYKDDAKLLGLEFSQSYLDSIEDAYNSNSVVENDFEKNKTILTQTFQESCSKLKTSYEAKISDECSIINLTLVTAKNRLDQLEQQKNDTQAQISAVTKEIQDRKGLQDKCNEYEIRLRSLIRENTHQIPHTPTAIDKLQKRHTELSLLVKKKQELENLITSIINAPTQISQLNNEITALNVSIDELNAKLTEVQDAEVSGIFKALQVTNRMSNTERKLKEFQSQKERYTETIEKISNLEKLDLKQLKLQYDDIKISSQELESIQKQLDAAHQEKQKLQTKNELESKMKNCYSQLSNCNSESSLQYRSITLKSEISQIETSISLTTNEIQTLSTLLNTTTRCLKNELQKFTEIENENYKKNLTELENEKKSQLKKIDLSFNETFKTINF